MPVRIVGMIGVTPPNNDTTLHVIEGGLSPSYLAQFARAHDEADFDLALVGQPHRRPRASSLPFMRPDTPTGSAISWRIGRASSHRH
jgi:hypothetical protein